MHSVGVTLFSMIFRKLLALDMQLILYQLTYSAYLYTTHNYHAVCILKWFWTLSLSCVWVQNAMVRGWTHVHVYTHAHGTVGIRLVTYHTWGENTLISNVTGLLKWTHGYIVDDTTANTCATTFGHSWVAFGKFITHAKLWCSFTVLHAWCAKVLQQLLRYSGFAFTLSIEKFAVCQLYKFPQISYHNIFFEKRINSNLVRFIWLVHVMMHKNCIVSWDPAK